MQVRKYVERCFTSTYEGPKRNSSTEGQFGKAYSIRADAASLFVKFRAYTHAYADSVLLRALLHIHTRTRVRMYTRCGVVWFRSGPEARRQRASDVSLSRPHSVAMQLESVNRDPHLARQKPRARLLVTPIHKWEGRSIRKPQRKDAAGKERRRERTSAND